MIFVVMGVAALAYFIWLGRGGARRGGQAGLLWTLGSVAAAGAAVFVGLRGGWVISLGLVAVSLFLSQRTRITGRARQSYVPRSPPTEAGMSVREAQEILGVSPVATRAEIETAFRRLMQRAHPDHGGSAGLAAKINAARDRLLG